MEIGTSKASKYASAILAWSIYLHWVNEVKHQKFSCAVWKSKNADGKKQQNDKTKQKPGTKS